jgi:putative hydroxymethylpyrimidine transport system substrate-binding protein
VKFLVALLAALVGLAVLQACGGAEPDASRQRGALLTLDFRPNAVHTGIYAAAGSGVLEDAGVDLTIRQPGSSAEVSKLLGAGRTDFAVVDIADLALARSQGLPLVAIAAVVQEPLAAVIAGPGRSGRPQVDLEGSTVGVTGTPADDLVLDTVLDAQGLVRSDIDTVNIGFGAVAALSGGRLDAATTFWNAEGVELQRAGIPTRELRIQRYGAPDYPQLLLAVNSLDTDPDSPLGCSLLKGMARGYSLVLEDPDRGLGFLLDANPALDRSSQEAQLEALLAGRALTDTISIESDAIREWIAWAEDGNLLTRKAAVAARGMIPPPDSGCAQLP